MTRMTRMGSGGRGWRESLLRAHDQSRDFLESPLPLTTVALVMVALVAGTAVSTWQAIRATQAEALAEVNEGKARDEQQKAIAAREAEALERRRAEEQTRLVEEQWQQLVEKERVSDFVVDQIFSMLRDLPKDAAARHRLLINALASIGELPQPDRVLAYERIADYFMALKELPSAANAYASALAIEPNNLRLHIGQGDILYRQLNYQAAAHAYNRVIEQGQSDATAMETFLPYARRGHALCNQGNFAEALADIRASYAAFPQATISFLGKKFAHHDVGILYWDLDELAPGIIELLGQFVRDQKHSPKSVLLRGNVLGN